MEEILLKQYYNKGCKQTKLHFHFIKYKHWIFIINKAFWIIIKCMKLLTYQNIWTKLTCLFGILVYNSYYNNISEPKHLKWVLGIC